VDDKEKKNFNAPTKFLIAGGFPPSWAWLCHKQIVEILQIFSTRSWSTSPFIKFLLLFLGKLFNQLSLSLSQVSVITFQIQKFYMLSIIYH